MSDEKYEIKEGTFSMFKVDADKKKKDSSPDFNGSAKLSAETISEIMGAMVNKTPIPELSLSGWGKVSKNGKVYVNGYIDIRKGSEKPPQEAIDTFLVTDKIAQVQAGQTAEAAPDYSQTQEDSDLPFVLTIPFLPYFLLAASALSMLC